MTLHNDIPTVIVTGASSGIGRATAHAFARRGAQVVLAARRAEMLEDAARECVGLGGTALAVPADVTQEEQVEALGRRALERFGRIDVWFNNAGVGAFGRLESIPMDAWRRVIETNLFGYVHGARVAMRQFRAQGQGTLIQNASIVGRTAKPDGTPYATSKFAIRGLSEALRQEVLDQPGIQVCTVLPSVIDTPFFQHAANYSGRQVRAAPPVYTAEEVAETVVALVEQPRAEVIVGGFGKIAVAQERMAPGLTTWLTGRNLHRGFLGDGPSGDSAGALFEPARDGRAVDGGWRARPDSGGAQLAALFEVAPMPPCSDEWALSALTPNLTSRVGRRVPSTLPREWCAQRWHDGGEAGGGGWLGRAGCGGSGGGGRCEVRHGFGGIAPPNRSS